MSSAFHEHLKRYRENLLSLQKEEQESNHLQSVGNANHDRLVSFQDVRNHFDQREMVDNEPNSPQNAARMNQLPPRRKNNEDDGSCNNQSALETDWEDVFHRSRR